MLRVEDNRYWSYVCANPECCPPDGTPFDVTDHPATRAFAASGRRVLASRAELAATVAPADGEQAMAMRRATRAAERQVARCAGRMGRGGHRGARRRLIAAAGQPMVADAIRRYRSGEAIDPELAAWLTVALRQVRVRDDAWARMLPEHGDAHTAALDRPDPAGAARVRGGAGVAAGLRRLAAGRRGAGQRRA